MEDKISDYHKIRPSARLIETIGTDLIKDAPAAILELVKNAYDADSKYVNIQFSSYFDINNEYKLKIVVQDDGHGMDYDTVVNKWMVPATNDKLARKYSPGGRIMQGRKGIGRFATAFLGEELLMETVDRNGIKTNLIINWEDLKKYEFLDDISILIESQKTNELSGTKLEIFGSPDKLYEWTQSAVDELNKELSKLISPINSKNVNSFIINLRYENLLVGKTLNDENIFLTESYQIEPYPILELYDYRLSGTVSKFGKTNLVFENKSAKGIKNENLIYDINLPLDYYCGKLRYDIRVFDRDPESLDVLINKGLRDSVSGMYLGKKEARELLNTLCGISIYREDFRIRPYGESTFDWLELDKQRVQNPSKKIGHNQVIGFIIVEQEENSNLEEKSARDGLKENKNYQGLVKITNNILSELEKRRFVFRLKTGKGRKFVKVEQELNKLFDFNNLNQKVHNKLMQSNIENNIALEIEDIIKNEEEDKSKILEEIKITIAVYQGQATLGKIVMVVLHEGRKPLGYFKNQAPVLISWINELNNKYDPILSESLSNRILEIANQTEFFVNLFDRLKPLAIKKRPLKKNFKLKNSFEKVIRIFEYELRTEHINIKNNIGGHIVVYGWDDDFYILFSNLIENSIYWLKQNGKKVKEITVTTNENNGELILDFYDNGPGIEKQYIENGAIFEPGFTTKGDGTGLGLAIAGEALDRNNGKLEAIYSDNGAYFRCEIKKENF